MHPVSNIIKPFIDNYDYMPSNSLAADETYIIVKGRKGYVWFIMDAVSRSILDYTISDTRTFEVTPVIGLSNDDEVSERYRPFKQKIERLNRTYKATYRVTNGYDMGDGALSSLVLWVAYYNFLRPQEILKLQEEQSVS